MAKKSLTTKVVDYATRNARYIGARMIVKSCTRNTNLGAGGIRKKGYFVDLVTKLNPNLLTTVPGYSMSNMRKGTHCTMDSHGMVVLLAEAEDYIAIDKADKAFDKALAKMNFS